LLELHEGAAFMETNSDELVRDQLARMLASAGFVRNHRLSGFLRFIVEQEMAGRGDQLKESVIGVEVFGRRPDYDVRQDSVVRTEAARLRARLAEYYLTQSVPEPLAIELPKGGYRPIFKQAALPSEQCVPVRKPTRRNRWWIAAGAAAAVAAIAALGLWRLHADAPISIAVLPLANLSQDPTDDYFADGLTGEIIRDLAVMDGMVVRSQTSSFAYKGKPRSVRQVGEELGADYVLEGSVLRAGKQLRINAQLVRVRDDAPLWSGRYDRELTDVFAIQDEISRGIVNSLRLKLGRGRRRYDTSAEAYDLYLRARAFEIASKATGRNQNVGLYQQAIAKDPSFAPAYAGLGAAYAYRTGEDRLNWEGPSREEEISQMHLLVAKALQLDPLLGEAYEALGMVQSRDGQWAQAERSFRRAIELEPGRPETRTDFALFVLLPLGRFREAMQQGRLAEKSDPKSSDLQSVLAYILFSAGRIDEAVSHCEKPCVRAMSLQGRADEAIPILEAQFKGRLTDPSAGQLLGYAYARDGRRKDAERIAAINLRPIEQAVIFTGLGDKDRAFEALDRAIPLGAMRVGRNLTWPEFEPLRGDVRLKALREKLGLPN
jgi:TolB-like protein/Flp pilus assembly protein TadD